MTTQSNKTPLDLAVERQNKAMVTLVLKSMKEQGKLKAFVEGPDGVMEYGARDDARAKGKTEAAKKLNDALVLLRGKVKQQKETHLKDSKFGKLISAMKAQAAAEGYEGTTTSADAAGSQWRAPGGGGAFASAAATVSAAATATGYEGAAAQWGGQSGLYGEEQGYEGGEGGYSYYGDQGADGSGGGFGGYGDGYETYQDPRYDQWGGETAAGAGSATGEEGERYYGHHGAAGAAAHAAVTTGSVHTPVLLEAVKQRNAMVKRMGDMSRALYAARASQDQSESVAENWKIRCLKAEKELAFTQTQLARRTADLKRATARLGALGLGIKGVEIPDDDSEEEERAKAMSALTELDEKRRAAKLRRKQNVQPTSATGGEI